MIRPFLKKKQTKKTNKLNITGPTHVSVKHYCLRSNKTNQIQSLHEILGKKKKKRREIAVLKLRALYTH